MARLISRTMLVLAWAGVASGCALGGKGREQSSGSTVRVTVLNPSYAPVSVAVCGPTQCSPPREIAGERQADFSFDAAGGTRAVVTASRGDRVVDQQPLDFLPGQRYRIVLDVP
jgi:hypothetical protein